MKPFVLGTDASGVGVAAVLLQENEGKFHFDKRLGPSPAVNNKVDCEPGIYDSRYVANNLITGH